MKFAIVASDTRKPCIESGNENSDLSQSSATDSTQLPNDDETQLYAFWSYVEANQSAANAAGVTPPARWRANADNAQPRQQPATAPRETQNAKARP